LVIFERLDDLQKVSKLYQLVELKTVFIYTRQGRIVVPQMTQILQYLLKK